MKILIADDEATLLEMISRLLEDEGYETTAVSNGIQCIEQARTWEPELVLLDMKMPGKTGQEVIKELNNLVNPPKIIMMTAYSSIPGAVLAIRSGAYDYIPKPFENEALLIAVGRALAHKKVEQELAQARSELRSRYSLSGIITNSPHMNQLLESVKLVAPTDVPVLITGESGTGKELFARAVHGHSNRKNNPFVAINCGALPGTLLESELFGYVRGAFSGAGNSKRGLVEQANGGTLFLDEIGEMSQEAQVKLLRFAQSNEFFSVGSTVKKTVDVRLVAASNKNLGEEIKKGTFRDDLFYRLNVVSIVIPPLRQRIEDLTLLIQHFVKKHGTVLNKENFTFTSEAFKTMEAYDWPGNIRELENAIRSALVMAPESPIPAELLPSSLHSGTESEHSHSLDNLTQKKKAEAERSVIQAALEANEGNRTHAARKLGISRRTLIRKINKYSLDE